jgi:Matrixin
MKRLLAFVAVVAAVLGLMTSVNAQSTPSIYVREVHGARLANGGHLWVHVYHAKGGIPGPPGGGGGGGGGSCTDTNTQTAYATFAAAKATSMAFKLYAPSVPSYLGTTAVANTMSSSFGAWNAVHNYYSFSSSGGVSQPADDATNSVGFGMFTGPGAGSALAATWSWTDSNNRIKGADIFFNTKFTFGIFTTCNAQSTYELGDLATHEIGHTAGLAHVSDSQAMATMYPSAPTGEVRKRTLTTGDKNGFEAQV